MRLWLAAAFAIAMASGASADEAPPFTVELQGAVGAQPVRVSVRVAGAALSGRAIYPGRVARTLSGSRKSNDECVLNEIDSKGVLTATISGRCELVFEDASGARGFLVGKWRDREAKHTSDVWLQSIAEIALKDTDRYRDIVFPNGPVVDGEPAFFAVARRARLANGWTAVVHLASPRRDPVDDSPLAFGPSRLALATVDERGALGQAVALGPPDALEDSWLTVEARPFSIAQGVSALLTVVSEEFSGHGHLVERVLTVFVVDERGRIASALVLTGDGGGKDGAHSWDSTRTQLLQPRSDGRELVARTVTESTRDGAELPDRVQLTLYRYQPATRTYVAVAATDAQIARRLGAATPIEDPEPLSPAEAASARALLARVAREPALADERNQRAWAALVASERDAALRSAGSARERTTRVCVEQVRALAAVPWSDDDVEHAAYERLDDCLRLMPSPTKVSTVLGGCRGRAQPFACARPALEQAIDDDLWERLTREPTARTVAQLARPLAADLAARGADSRLLRVLVELDEPKALAVLTRALVEAPVLRDRRLLDPLLARALRAGRLQLARLCLRNGADIDYRDMECNGYSILNCVLFGQDADPWSASGLERLKFVIAAGARTDRDERAPMAPLNAAIEQAPTEIVHLLMARRALPAWPGPPWYPPLFRAIDQRDAQLVAYLLDHGGDPEIEFKYIYTLNEDVTKDYQMTPLCLAAAMGEVEIVKVLVDHRARIDRAARVFDRQGSTASSITALQAARRNGRRAVVELLLARGACE
jgi:hypothetical protein